MTLRFMDGFDAYNSAALATLKGWFGTGTPTSSGTAHGVGQCMPMPTNAFRRSPDLQSTWIVGYRIKIASAVNAAFLSFNDVSGNIQLSWQVDTAGHVKVFRAGSTLLATSNETILAGSYAGAWFYAEMKAFIDGTTGFFHCRINETALTWSAANTGVNTKPQTAAGAQQFNFNPSGATITVDDLYMCDGTGAANNDFLGDCKVRTLLPDSAGAHTDMSPTGAATNWQAVNDASPNGDTSYVASATVGHIDSYNFGSLPSGGAVRGVQVSLYQRKDEGGIRVVASVVRHGGTDSVGSSLYLGDSYIYGLQQYDTNPVTGVAWDNADMEAMQFGVKVIS